MTGPDQLKSPGSDGSHQRGALCDGAARLRFVRGEAGTELARLFQQGSLRVFRPRIEAGDCVGVVLLNTSGGIVGGDALKIRVRLESGAAAVITSQAAEKAYRSAGADTTVGVDLVLADEAWLEWLPQETILFDGARVRRTLRMDLAARACLLAAELLVFGRRACGERFRTGLLQERWEVRVAGRLVWADAMRLASEPGVVLDAPFGFAGAGALATCIHVAPNAADRVGLARDLAEGPDAQSGVTSVGPVLITRWLAADAAPLRRALQQFWARFRHAVAGWPDRVPAIWRT